jgi:predicted kinase
MPEYRHLPQTQRQTLFLAALLHDVGKPMTTRQEGNDWVAPSHSTKGAHLARYILWKEFGMCGTPELQAMREAVVLLVKHHSFPPYALEKEENVRKMISIAASAELVPDFSLKLLHLLSKADALGRECEDKADFTAQVDLFAELAKEQGCYDTPLDFASGYTRRAYFSGGDVWPQQELYDESWGEVLMLCGLPGTGKDYWISKHCKNMPVVSLDDIRRRHKLSPEGSQGYVASLGKEEAKIYLRKHQPFVWNATNLTVDIRRQLIELFESYGASVRVVYLETDLETQLRRNAGREDRVPETIIDSMLSKLAVPEIHEARCVQWLCV